MQELLLEHFMKMKQLRCFVRSDQGRKEGRVLFNNALNTFYFTVTDIW